MKKGLCWIRRDLRLHDHHALSKSLKENDLTYVCFIFDENILKNLKGKSHRRLSFITDSLQEIQNQLKNYDSELVLKYGDPVELLPQLVEELKIDSVYFNRDYDPYAKKRDALIEKALVGKAVNVFQFKDHVFYEKHEVLNQQGNVYQIFTPYKKRWLEIFSAQEFAISDYKCPLKKIAPYKSDFSQSINEWISKCGFLPIDKSITAGTDAGFKLLKQFENKIAHYKKTRDFPYLHGTSKLSVHIRFGTISIRDVIRTAIKNKNEGSSTWLSELIWRDFYQTILDAFPQVVNHCFRSEYDKLSWENNESFFKAWCDGQTGYPIVDAAMRELNQTGFMHNRLRMVVASFLTKTLLVDWRMGEQYFADQLIDYDKAANNGGWQWSASTGVDAQPYFRIFNPYNQSFKFDPKGEYIRQWCPELSGFSNKEIHAPQDTEFPEQDRAQCFVGEDYPAPIVSYKEQKVKALAMFRKIKRS